MARFSWEGDKRLNFPGRNPAILVRNGYLYHRENAMATGEHQVVKYKINFEDLANTPSNK